MRRRDSAAAVAVPEECRPADTEVRPAAVGSVRLEEVALPATLLFVHGTGVRAEGYTATLRQIEQRAVRYELPVTVCGCFWGEAEGAHLAAGGRSIPDYAGTGGGEPTEDEKLVALWSVLYTDPWYELRLLRHAPTAGAPRFGEEPPAERLRRAVREFAPSAELEQELAAAGLTARFNDALGAIRAAAEFEQALLGAPPDALDHRRAIARALLAYALVEAEDAGEPAPSGAVRDALVLRLTDELHGHGMGVSDFLLRPVAGIAKRVATKRLTRKRGSITDAAAPASGDILRFLANGDGVRRYLRAAVADVATAGPVYLLAHSLGGIMCVDLLIREAIPGVAGLITIGSQAPFLYEIGALPGLTHPTPLPEHFPPWLNVYDPRDLLAYVGAGVWGGRVSDVKVDNGQPFPQSHSAYWSNEAVWSAIATLMT